MPPFTEKINFDFDATTVVPCSYKDLCSGCQFLGQPYGEQTDFKVRHLKQIFIESSVPLPSPIKVLSGGPAYLRDRLDFSLEDGRLGLYRRDRKEILDIDFCAQLSPALQEWLTEFRHIHWPFKKGSIRLRVGPKGQKGVWLDFANIDIKALLDEKSILKNLQEKAFVEIGQRRKVPVWTGSEFKLQDPELHVWFQTWMGEQPLDLYCQVASFTQPSLRANKIICDVISGWIQDFPSSRLIEFGSGIGNLTFSSTVCSRTFNGV